MHGPHRRLLLELHRALAAVAPEARAAAARACVAGWELPFDLELAAAPESAARLAVRLVHQLEMRGAPVCARLGPLVAEAGQAPALRAALAAAPLIAGREGRALICMPLGAVAGAGAQGALVDAETCARIALAGGELESGPAGTQELLALAGDLVAAPPASAGDGVLLAALRLGLADASRCLARVPVITMPDKDL